MSIPWLKEVLVAEGVRVVEEGDWVNRAAAGGTFDPIGVLWHHTAFSSSAANPAPALSTVIAGRPDLEGPLCHALVDYTGVFHLIAGGLANHAGPTRASGPIPAGEGNTLLIGWEIDYAGDQRPEDGVPDQHITPAQYDASVKATAAVLRRLGRDASYARGHRETSTTGKIDPSYVDLDQMRADVAVALAGPDGPSRPVTDTGAGAVLVNGDYHVFGISPTGLLYENVWAGVWSGWRSLGGVVRGTPAVVAGNNRIDVFIVGTDGAMHQKTWSGTWGGWRNLGGKFADFSGAGAVLANGQYHVFGISPTGLLYENVWKNSWSGWRSLGGLVRGTPAVTATGDRIDVFVLGRTGSMLQKTWNGTWGAYRDLGGKFADKSGAGAVLVNGQYHVFGISPTNLLYENTWTGTWTGWRSLGGLVRGTPAATTTGNRIDVFTIGTDANMHQKTWNGTWGAYRNLGGTFG